MRLLCACPLLVVLAWSRPVDACSCVPYDDSPRGIRKLVADYDLVFEGKVRSVDLDIEEDEKVAVLDVHRSWRGAPGASVTIRTRPHAPACGAHFEPNTTYIVFAYADKAGNFHTTSCDPNDVSKGRIARALGDSRPGPGRGCTIASDPPPFALLLLLLAPRRRRNCNQ